MISIIVGSDGIVRTVAQGAYPFNLADGVIVTVDDDAAPCAVGWSYADGTWTPLVESSADPVEVA
jgi:hypothetical protein